MGVSVEQWRAVTGRWAAGVAPSGAGSGGNVNRNNQDGGIGEQLFWLAVLAILLVIGGVELNPGPPINEDGSNGGSITSEYTNGLQEKIKNLLRENDLLRIDLEQSRQQLRDQRHKWYREKNDLKQELHEMDLDRRKLIEEKDKLVEEMNLQLRQIAEMESSNGTCSRKNRTTEQIKELTPTEPITSTVRYVDIENTLISDQPLLRYQKTPAAADTSGQDFEVKMLALLFLRGINNNYEFYLGANVRAAGAFDDIVFRYRTRGQEEWTTTFMQLKHKQTRQVTLPQLLSMSTKGDFSLNKYCKSYVHMKGNYESDADLHCFGKFDKFQFILYTNASLSTELEKQKRKKSVRHHLFTSHKNGLAFSLFDQDILNAVKEMLAFRQLLNEWVTDDADRKQNIEQMIVSFSVENFGMNVELHATCKELSKTFSKEKLLKILQNMEFIPDLHEHEEFLGKLKIFTNQAKENELDNIIKAEIKLALQITDDKELKQVYDGLIVELKNWGKQSPSFYLRENSLFWKNIIFSWITNLSKPKVIEMELLNVTFRNSAVDKIFQCVPKSGVFNIVASGTSTALSYMKVYQALTRSEVRRCIFVRLKSLLQNQDEFLCAWQQNWCRCLVIEGEPDCKEFDVEQLSIRLQNVIKDNHNRPINIILVTSINDVLAENLKCDFLHYEELNDECRWNELTDDSQNNVLCRIVNFQGKNVPLKSLINQNESLKQQQLNGDTLNNLLQENIKFGQKLDSCIKYYVPRKCGDSGATFDILSYDNMKSKQVIIAAEPGMGKSTLLTHLAQSAKEKDPCKWVVRINLIDCSTYLDSIKGEMVDEKSTVQFMKHFCLGKESDSYFEKALFKYFMLVSGKMIIFFDAFDEICPYYKNKVCEIISNLLKTKIGSLWITSRLGEKGDLEKTMDVKSYSLEPFTKADQQIFLKKFWKERVLDIEESQLNDFTDKVLQLAADAFKGPDSNLVISIPQQTLMLGEYFEDKLKDWKVTDSLHLLPITFNILDLYDYFVDKKFETYISEKKKDDTTNAAIKSDNTNLKSSFLENHKKAALYLLLSSEELSSLHIDVSQIDAFLNRINEGHEKTGIIDKNVSDNKPNFIHRTFAEYFVALWCTENYRAHRTFLKDKLYAIEFKVVKRMFDLRLAKHFELHTAVVSRDLQAIEKCVSSNIDVNQKDLGGRTALHLIAAYWKTDDSDCMTRITESLLNRGASLDIFDDVFQWRPLHYADKTTSWRIVELFLQNGGSVDDLIEIKANTNPDVFLELVNLFTKVQSNYIRLMLSASHHGQLDVIRYLVKEHKANIKVCDEAGVTSMHRAAQGGHVEVMTYLKREGANFTVTDNERNTPILLAAEYDRVDAMQFLLRREAFAKISNAKSLTDVHRNISLIVASFQGTLNIVKSLIKCHASVNYANKGGATPLHFAAMKLNMPIITLLLNKGANVNSKDTNGKTPLLRTVQDIVMKEQTSKIKIENDRLSVVKYLVQKGGFLRTDVNNVSYSIVDFVVETGHINHIKDYLTRELCDIANIAFVNCREGNIQKVKSCVEKGIVLKEYRPSTSAGFSCLHGAVKSGNLELVKYVLEDWTDIDMRCKSDTVFEATPLMIAAFKGDSKIVETLVKHGADIEAVGRLENIQGNTPLHFSAASGDKETVKILVRNKSNINARRCDDKTPLIVAVQKGHYKVIEYLVEEGVNVNAYDKDGNNSLSLAMNSGRFDIVQILCRANVHFGSRSLPTTQSLHIAAKEGYLEMTEKLIQQGYSINSVDNDGNTALHIAVSENQASVVNLLLGVKASVDLKNKVNSTPLHLAACLGHTDIATQLIEAGADMDACSLQWNNMDNPLHLAAVGNHYDIVKLLLGKGASVDSRNRSNNTPLHLACHRGFLNIAELLVDAGADIETSGNNGNTPLYLATCTNHIECVQLLLGKGASVDSRTRLLCTPLHAASSKGFLNVAKLLVDAGADTNVVNDKGDSPLLLAAFLSHIECVELLLSKGAFVDARNGLNRTPLHFAVQKGISNLARVLIDAGADIDAVDNNGNTPLAFAAHFAHIECLQLLLNNGALVDFEYKLKHTLLHIMSCKGDTAVVEYLLKNGADFEKFCAEEYRPLHYASQFGHLDIVKLLIKYGADINAKNAQGLTPHQLAVIQNFSDVAKFLARNGAEISMPIATAGSAVRLLNIEMHFTFNPHINNDIL